MSRLPEKTSLLALDFDGVPTDDRVIVHQDGSESVVCSRAVSRPLGISESEGNREHLRLEYWKVRLDDIR